MNGNPYAHPPLLQSVVLAGLVISAVLVTVARRRHTWLPITMAVLYALVAWGMILLSNRFLSLREATLTDERFNADVLAAAVVALALVMGSVPVGRPTDPGAGVRDTGGTRRATAALLCLTGSLLVANVSQVRRLAEQPDRGWTTAILSDLSETDTPVTLWDANTPSTVLHPGYYPDQARLSYALAPLEADVSFREVAERLTMVDDRGRLRGVAVSPTSESREGPVDGCGYSVGGGDSVDVPVTSSLFYWDWALQVNAFAGESSTLDVGVGDSTTRIPIRPGLRQYQAQIAAEVKSHVTITSPPGSPTVCVTEVLIGNVEPVDD